MVTCADSSFLVSLYIPDRHTDLSQNYLKSSSDPIHLTSFAKSETQHALRSLVHRKVISEKVLHGALLQFENDQDEGLYELVSLETDLLFRKTSELSVRHAQSLGVRYLDMLHVAAALLVKGERFLTFDDRQCRLAKAVKLDTPAFK